MEDKTIFTFTKETQKHTIELTDIYNEIISVNAEGFIIMQVAKIDLEYKISEHTKKPQVAIILKNRENKIVAKDFVIDFKDTDKLIFEQRYFDFCYCFKLIKNEK